MDHGKAENEALLSTGVAGLDDVLHGGLAPHRLYLIEGTPGSGKTTLALQFLIEGAKRGERGLFASMSETEDELRSSAAAHGFDLSGISIVVVSSADEAVRESSYTMFHPSEVELSDTVRRVLQEAERVRADRVVIDSLSELRLLAGDALHYRRQIVALKQFFMQQRSTLMCTDDGSGDHSDMHLHSISHGVICLNRTTPEVGVMRRRLQVTKLRGRAFREGYHDYRIVPGGLEVYPNLIASEHHLLYQREPIRSGLDALDALLGGGLARGTSNLIIGPAGSGKSTIAAQYAAWAAQQGGAAAIYLFDESIATFRERSVGLGVPIEKLLESGRLQVRQVDVAEMSPGQFVHQVRAAVEQDGVRVLVIDSVNGFMHAMPSDKFLTLQLHELLMYLSHRGVTTLMIMAQHGFAGGEAHSPVDVSYLADTVVLLRYFEARGAVRQALSVMKKRTGPHERTIRELKFENGLRVGDAVREFQGVLSGTPLLLGEPPVGPKA